MDVRTKGERDFRDQRFPWEIPEQGGGRDLTKTALAAAAVLMGWGMLRRRLGWPLMVTGLGLGALGIRRFLQEPTDQGVKVAKAVTIDRPRDEVYRAWHEFERLPRILHHVDRVEMLDGGRMQWTARLAPNTPALTWTAEVVEDRENELIHWRSVPGSMIHDEGVVTFIDAPGGRGTELHARLSYRPGTAPGGRNVARIFRPIVAREIRQDLHRFKQFLETGEVATARNQPSH